MTRRTVAIIILLLLLPASVLAEHTRDEVREAYRAIRPWEDHSPYNEKPTLSVPYAAGALEDGAIANALDYLNFVRWLAELEPVEGSIIYNYQCQHAAALLAVLDYVDHNAPRPADMDVNFYDSAHIGTTSGNIARFNWMRNTIVREGVAYFVRDDGDANLGILGHRRWSLNPLMASTGFGLANAGSGMSYVVMYAHDLCNRDAEWAEVVWPTAGAFPAELMHDHLAWSVTLNPALYDLAASDPVVTLAEDRLGLRFVFHPARGTGDGFCAVNLEPYGAGGCICFRPDFEGTDFTDYQQNQRWRVSIEGLITTDAKAVDISYETQMISLRAVDPVNIEISTLEAVLSTGEAFQLGASVIPDYADDLSVVWASDDPAVATVDAQGRVIAVGVGHCAITCMDVMGHADNCRVTVTG